MVVVNLFDVDSLFDIFTVEPIDNTVNISVISQGYLSQQQTMFYVVDQDMFALASSNQILTTGGITQTSDKSTIDVVVG